MQVEEFLEHSVQKYPEKIALICDSRRFTYLQIEQEANRIAHALIASGVRRGDRVVIALSNSLETVLAIFATLKCGAVFVVVNASTKPEKLNYILNNCRASAAVLPAAALDLVPVWLHETQHLHSVLLVGGLPPHFDLLRSSGKTPFSFDELREKGSDTTPPCKSCIDIDLAALIYTSGSTGRPKGVMMTHLNIISAANSITQYLQNQLEDIVINVLPLAFDYGLYQLLMMFKVGGTLVLLDSFAYPHLVLEKIIQEQVTGFPIVPTMSAILLQMNLTKYNFSKLRYITNTAAALPVEHIRKLVALFPGVKIFSMYGLTECKRVSFLPPDQIDIRPASVGCGMPNVEVYVVDPSGNRVPPGVVGELVIRGSNVMKGYWEMPEITDKCLRPGALPGEKVLYSGDSFYTDEEGYLYFVSRTDDIIKTRGEKVSPKEIEEVLHSLEGIAEAAVVGVPDPILGSAVKAVVVLRKGVTLTRQDILRHCSANLEDFMVPKFIDIWDSLPRTESGKVSKRMIAQSDSRKDPSKVPN